MFDRTHPGFVDFIRESNRIEGILRDPTEDEIATPGQSSPSTLPLQREGFFAPESPMAGQRPVI
jgi:hypothetical protein